ncbi:MAG: RluA family pseudouridine synthase [Salegentibacter sp.]
MTILETHIVPKVDEKIRLQEYAVSIFKSIPTRSGIKKAIKRGELLLNGRPAKTSDWIQEGQKLELLKPELSTREFFKLRLPVIFEDEFIAVINKPAGFPTSGNYFKTIENALPLNLKISGELDALPSPLPAHRLDNPTAGLLICAKTRNSLSALHLAFDKKEIEKEYTALVHGITPEKAVFDDPVQGKEAKTRMARLEFYKIKNDHYSLVKLSPETGRTHQLRIHLASAGTPIVQDELYGKASEFFQNKILFLLATGLNFEHPVTKKRIELQLPLPKRFRKIKDWTAEH